MSRLDSVTRKRLIKFLLRTTFIFTLDNIGLVLLQNFGITALAAGSIFLAWKTAGNFPVLMMAVLLCISVISWYLQSSAFHLENTGLKPVRCLRLGLKPGLSFGLVFAFCIIFLMTAVPFYFSIKSLAGYIPLLLIFCCLIISASVFQMFIPLKVIYEGNLLHIIRTAFKLIFAEPLIIVIITVNSVCLLLLSVLTAFLIPGAACVQLLWLETCRWILKLYEEGIGHEQLIMLIDTEEKKSGKRTIKSFILPWIK